MSQHSICATNNKKGAILVFAVGIMIVVAVLALALIMLSTSQIFLVQTQKKELQGYYGAETQIYWVAYQLQADPYYDGEEIYPVEGAQEIIVSITCTTLPIRNTEVLAEQGTPLEVDEFDVKAYIKYAGVFGKQESEVRLDAVVERRIVQNPPGTFRITTEIKDWQQIKPPLAP
ncbi:MAG: hypothetical protein PHQ54_03330 [Candidatus Omnitrophica bacterium]|nr:hypothetical protein [Candidatus Omnitrophota bacterium]